MSKKQIIISSLVVSITILSFIIYVFINQPTRIEIAKQIIKNIDTLTETLEKVQDKESAIEHKSTLINQIKVFKTTLNQADNLSYPPDDEIIELDEMLTNIESKTAKLIILIVEFWNIRVWPREYLGS